MDDILFSYPSACGESDCPVGWHISHVWTCGRGYSQCDSDGDHQPISAADVRSLGKNFDSMWGEYFQHVAETGTDPLDEINVPETRTQRQLWRAQIGPSICGPRLISLFRSGKKRLSTPEVVRYLNLKGGMLLDFKTIDELVRVVREESPDKVFVKNGVAHLDFYVDAQIKRKNYVRELKRAAKKMLKREVKK